MSRKYTYDTDLELNGVEREVKVTYECPEYEMIEDIQVLKLDGEFCQHSLSDDLAQKITDILAGEHEDHMITNAYVTDAEAHAEHLDRLDEQRAERAGWRF